MNHATRNEIELRAELFRKKYTERELRQMFADRTHDAEFASVARPMFVGRYAVPEHILVWTGFEAVVQSLMMNEDLVPCVAESMRGLKTTAGSDFREVVETLNAIYVTPEGKEPVFQCPDCGHTSHIWTAETKVRCRPDWLGGGHEMRGTVRPLSSYELRTYEASPIDAERTMQ